jgi:choline dehydrogenase/4-pyridoxate dehydrogenase
LAKTEHDYVIVGTGSAGCTLAFRLSEDPDVKVLVIEAGGWDINPWIRVPLGWPRILLRRMNDWMYFSEPEPHVGGRQIECARGKVVGGTSSINAMAYVRGHRGDYDRWAASGLTEWSYSKVLPYFRKQESWEGGANEFRGGTGPLTTRFSRYMDPLSEALTAAGLAAGYSYTADYNGEHQEGFGEWQATIRDGRRCSAAVAYLRPALARGNVSIVTNALATRILFDRNAAIGIEYARRGTIHTAFAAREVICSGGVINSPQLLNLSGIGDAETLRSLGIPVRIHLPGVGRNLKDQFSAAVTYLRRDEGPLHRSMRADRISIALANAYFRGKGIATDLPSSGMAFLKTSPEIPLPNIQLIPIAAPMTAGPYFAPFKRGYDDAFAIRVAVLRPESCGQITLRSADPSAAPIILQNFLSTQNDRATLRAGMRIVEDVGRQGPLRKYVARKHAPLGGSDGELDDYIRSTGISVHHPAGTCKMGIADDPHAVVDEQLRVLGARRLRVVDASVMPDLIGGAINAPVIMIAEKAADFIKGERRT